MSLRLVLAAAALTFAAPVLAQDAPPAPPVVAEAVDPAEAALEARGEAFGARMESMGREMEAAMAAAGPDRAAAGAALDAIAARYQPEADAFAEELKAFFEAKAAGVGPPEQKAEAASTGPMLANMIKGIPAMVRAQIEQAAVARTTPPAATE